MLHAICDRIAVLAEKRVMVVGTMDDMMRHQHPWIAEYFRGTRARAALATPAVTTEQLLDESASGATDPSANELGDGRRDAAMAMPMMPDAPLVPSE